MIIWLINPLELNLRWFGSSEKNDTYKNSYPEKGVPVQIYSLEKYTLR